MSNLPNTKSVPPPNDLYWAKNDSLNLYEPIQQLKAKEEKSYTPQSQYTSYSEVTPQFSQAKIPTKPMHYNPYSYNSL